MDKSITYSKAKREYMKKRQQEIAKQNDNDLSRRKKQTIETAREKIK